MHYKEFKENNSECFHYGKKMLTTKGKNILKVTWLYVYAIITKTMFGSWKVQRKEKEVSRKTSEQTYKKVIKLGELECYVAFSYRNNQQ